jgi:hypothetical protein
MRQLILSVQAKSTVQSSGIILICAIGQP